MAERDKLDIYTKGTVCWFKDSENGYISGTLANITIGDKVRMTFTLENNTEFIYEQSIKELEKSNYDELPMLKNPPRLEGCDDLTTLSYLHEAAVLHSVKIRYLQEIIYTYSGLVLIAMNPFKKLNIYTPEIMKQYCGRNRLEMDPHLFAVAEEAYRRLVTMRENQSVIVSGESGAGKTMTAKFVMKYFAIVDELGNNGKVKKEAGISIEDAVLSTNPIMEAFGNAKTTRNDNSSRFGKYIEIVFKRKSDVSVEITGAMMRTYLLERSRLTFQPESERNYHIFYQLCAACPAAEKQQLGLGSWDQFHYLRQGHTGSVPGMDDVEEFENTRKGMSTVGVSVNTQWEVFRVCAALLQIGNISITTKGDKALIDPSDKALLKACELLKLDPVEFHKWLCKRAIKMRSELIIKDCKLEEATTFRDSIAKFIYSSLFDWICTVCNNKLKPTGDASKDTRFIGVLDIYGFEHFQKNSFEQFCINFANEKLQQEFTRHVFKLEQQEYVAEQIQWSFIDFNDNQPCIEMIEGKLGIMDLLDEESRLPSGGDKSLIQKLYNRFGGDDKKFFVKPRFGEVDFIVKHYAIDVSYQIDGFIEKNKDTVTDEQLEMLHNTGMPFLKEVIKVDTVVDVKKNGSVIKKPTLGSIFKGSLIKLMETLRQTNPHYIRCIKPNQSKRAFEYEAQNVLGQLIACGVLETIKISRAGYPSKTIYNDFANRYYLLVSSKDWKCDAKELTAKICKQHLKAGKFELGLTKVFFRAGQMGYLEKIRSEKFLKFVILIQKNIRMQFRRKQYKSMKGRVKLIQAAFRRHKSGVSLRAEKEAWAVLTIQKNMRMFVLRRKHLKVAKSVRLLQRGYREYAAKRDTAMSAEAIAVSKIWATWLMYKQRLSYQRDVQDIIVVQSIARRKIATKNYRDLLRDYRYNNLRDENGKLINSLGQLRNERGKLNETNFALESKVIDLSITLEAKKSETEDIQKQCTLLGEHLASLKSKFMKLDQQTKVKTTESTKQVNQLKRTIVELQDTKEKMKRETDKLHGMIRKRDEYILQLQHYKTQKDAEVAVLREQLKNAPPKMDSSSSTLQHDIQNLRDQMQTMLNNKYKTEQRSEHFFHPESVAAGAAKASIAFLSTAAQNAGAIASSALGSTSIYDSAETADYKPLRPLRTMPVIDENKPKERSVRMLEAEELQEEVMENLIVDLRIPLPSEQKFPKQEILFPSHLIAYLLSEMLARGIVDAVREFSGNVARSIQHLTMKFEDDYITCFWFSNNFEMMSLIKPLRDNLPPPITSSQTDEHSASAVLATFQNELKHVTEGLYNGWIRQLRKRLDEMIVPAVVENQSLPGYICGQDTGYWTSWSAKPQASTSFTIDQLINFLTKLDQSMTFYHLEESIRLQVLTELVRIIGVNAFNHILVRKNFCTWKRGVQIQYNVSRLEEWCTGNNILDGLQYLEQLSQACKLLTMNKNTPNDIEQIVDVCFSLNSTQIKKLLSIYYASDFDTPLSLELLKVVTNKISSRSDESLLLNDDNIGKFVMPELRKVEIIEKMIPSWVELPCIRAILSLFEL